jgi:hypothetical protein
LKIVIGVRWWGLEGLSPTQFFENFWENCEEWKQSTTQPAMRIDRMEYIILIFSKFLLDFFKTLKILNRIFKIRLIFHINFITKKSKTLFTIQYEYTK